MARRTLPWIALLAAGLHLAGMVRSPLPAQDGLIFIRVARQFHTQPWADVVRNCDRHPLYPASIALAQPAVALGIGQGPDSWRIAAQAVSLLASLALLVPLYGLARALFDDRTAALACLLFVLLPVPAEIGHDTLSDALALASATLALYFGESALRSTRAAPALGCGIASGLGFLTRPEVVVVPAAVALAAWARPRTGSILRSSAWRPGVAALACLTIVGLYAMVKGEVSEKLAVRIGASLPGRHDAPREVAHWLPSGLDDPRWDFSPKEESTAPPRATFPEALGRVLERWAEGLGWIFAPMAVWGALRARASAGRRLAVAYVALFVAILTRHAMTLGYLSGRHLLSLIVVSLPWAAAGVLDCAQGLATRRAWEGPRARRWGHVAVAIAVVVGVAIQVKPGHPSRWGHRAAGRWLAGSTRPSDAVLDTRGWAAFVSGRPSYDYWHIRQALTDSNLAYVVVGADELAASSRRATTLRALLAYAAEPVATFPDHEGGTVPGVRIYRFRRPESWEGLRP